MKDGQSRKPSLLAVVKTVLWAFFGVRKRLGHEQDTVQVSPLQIIITGVIAAALFVTGLILLVRFIISNAGN